jgi:hypothetical protein
MNKEKKIYHTYIDFLTDDAFIEWGLMQTDEVNQYWNDYIKNQPEKQNEFNIAVEKFKAVKLNNYILPEEVKTQLYRKILRKAEKRKAVKRRITYLQIAASLGLLIVASYFFFSQKDEEALHIADVADVTDAIVIQPLPPSEVQLISADKVMELGQNAEIAISDSGHATLSKETDDPKNIALSVDVMNRLIVPAGKRSTLLLPDGSKIWINSGSELEFPTVFSGATRDIYVKGEIYIDVTPKEGKLFRVHTPQFKVTVRGTGFNVSAYADSDVQSVVLVNGKVDVNIPQQAEQILLPGELLDIKNNSVRINKVNTDEYTSWKDGILIFNKTSVADILKKISRYYNVTFEDKSNNGLSAKTCTGKLVLTDHIDDVMTALSVLSSTVFFRENETIYIKNQ